MIYFDAKGKIDIMNDKGWEMVYELINTHPLVRECYVSSDEKTGETISFAIKLGKEADEHEEVYTSEENP